MAPTDIDDLPNELLCKIWSRLTPTDQVMLKATKQMYNEELKNLGIDFSNFITYFTTIAAAAAAETTEITFYNDKYKAKDHTPFMYITFNKEYITFDVILPDSLDTFKNTLAHKLELKWFNPDKEDCFSLKIFHQGCEQIANANLDSKVPPETTIYKFIVDNNKFYHVDETTAELVKSIYELDKPDELVNYKGPCTGYPYLIKKNDVYYLRKWCATSINIETNAPPKLHVLHEIALIFYRFKNGTWISNVVADEKLKTALKTFTDNLYTQV